MKRIIKFRGMSINGDWHYGSLCILKEKHGLTIEGCYISNSVGMPFAYHVRSNTIGQFTGMQDSKGSDIYEGDIIREGYNEKYGRRVVRWEKDGFNLCQGGDDSWEVIGNIYEMEVY